MVEEWEQKVSNEQLFPMNDVLVHLPQDNSPNAYIKKENSKEQSNPYKGGLQYESNICQVHPLLYDQISYLKEREQNQSEEEVQDYQNSKIIINLEQLRKIVNGVVRELNKKNKKNLKDRCLRYLMRFLITKEKKYFERECKERLNIEEILGKIKQILKFKNHFNQQEINAQTVCEYFHMVCSDQTQMQFERIKHYKAKVWIPVFEGSIEADISELLTRPIGIKLFCRPLHTIATCLAQQFPELGFDNWIEEIRPQTRNLDTYFSITQLEEIQTIRKELQEKKK